MQDELLEALDSGLEVANSQGLILAVRHKDCSGSVQVALVVSF